MPRTIYDVTLAELTPPGFIADPRIAAICAAFDAMNQLVTNAIDRLSVLDHIGNQASDVTDLLAAEQRTPYYNQTLPLDIRRALLAGTGRANAALGTKAAVEETVRAAWGSGTVQEWFEYGGEPYHFRVLITDFPGSDQQIAEIRRAIEASKNARSYLDDIIVTVATTTAAMYLASTLSMGLLVHTKMQAPR